MALSFTPIKSALGTTWRELLTPTEVNRTVSQRSASAPFIFVKRAGIPVDDSGI
jgi:hypothetical protein